MNIAQITRVFAVALVVVLTATGLWATGAEEAPAAAADKEYVTDPTTGKVVVAPQYGGTITFVDNGSAGTVTDYYVSGAGPKNVQLFMEKLGIANWAIDRDVWPYNTQHIPDFALTGRLAESWEQPDLDTIIFKIRQGVQWHDKPPMNGRELTAADVEWSFHRLLGLGSGFTEPAPTVWALPQFRTKSVTATDQYTVVFELDLPAPWALNRILRGDNTAILPREVIEQYGDYNDWRNVVGTGPFMLTDHVEGTSWTYVKNPDYWGYDEKYPDNRLPYVDEIQRLISKEQATILAMMRTGKADYIGYGGDTQITSIDAATSLQETNPDLNLWPYSYRAETAMAFNTQISPWNDIRVRRAIQMAIDLETINRTYHQGWANPAAAAALGDAMVGYVTPFEEWPDDLKGYYTYDPERAEALLDEAGYPRGDNGVRFETVYGHLDRGDFDLDYFQIVMEYLRAIGIDIEVEKLPVAQWGSYINDHLGEGLFLAVHNADYITAIDVFYSTNGWNPSNVNDPVFDATMDAFRAATATEEQQRLVREAVMRVAEQHWTIAGPRVPSFIVTQPWLVGYSGEVELGEMDRAIILSRLWIDQDLKAEMGS
ncbi:MAG: ABC transporter substrate-binding protein [Spirochaetaceae bacterium]|nr:ABC transporter substrate-binding protein [Spirochaetaceae bacterium]